MSLRPLLLGHRGARAIKSLPENTPGSFDRALADGCDGFEFDVRITADRQAVICHDPRFRKVTIAEAQAHQLKSLPHLEHILEVFGQRAFLDIELKVPGLEEITVDLIDQYKPSRGCVVSSFLPEVLRHVHTKNPAIPLGLICETAAQLEPWRKLPSEYVIVHHTLANETLIKEIHAAGRKIFVWTVNRAFEMKRFAMWGVDGIISDDTRLLGSTL
jgi:glycerophosphoryl diester phosphodiesterase